MATFIIDLMGDSDDNGLVKEISPKKDQKKEPQSKVLPERKYPEPGLQIVPSVPLRD